MQTKHLAVCAAIALSVCAWAGRAVSAALGDWVNDLAKEYNASQTKYKVVPTYKASTTNP